MVYQTTALLYLLSISLALVKNKPTPVDTIDMSHPFDKNIVTTPGMLPFNLALWFKGPHQEAPFVIGYNLEVGEHVGTHIDAPLHFNENGASVDEIPPENMIGEAIVVNITEQVTENLDYELTVKDLMNWEDEYGKIPDHCIMFVLTGFGKYWGDYEKYLGLSGANSHDFHYPGIHKDTAQWLVDTRKIKGIGVDTRSLDNGPSSSFLAHRIFLGNNIYGLESVANIEKLPAKGAIVYVMPMKIKGGSGGPTRIIARVVTQENIHYSLHHKHDTL